MGSQEAAVCDKQGEAASAPHLCRVPERKQEPAQSKGTEAGRVWEVGSGGGVYSE